MTPGFIYSNVVPIQNLPTTYNAIAIPTRQT